MLGVCIAGSRNINVYCPRTVIKIQQCGMKKISQYQYFVRR